ADQVDFVLLQGSDDFAVMLFSWLALGRDDQGFESNAVCDFEAAGVRLVGDNDSDAGVGDLAGSHVVSDGFEVRAASGEKDAEVFHGSYQLSAFDPTSKSPRRFGLRDHPKPPCHPERKRRTYAFCRYL